MRLYWRKDEIEDVFLGSYDNWTKLRKAMWKFFKTNYIKSYYQRYWEDDGKIWVDYGSHTQFLYITDYTPEQFAEMISGGTNEDNNN